MRPAKYVPRAAWGARPRGASSRTHPLPSTLGVTLHWEGPRMGRFDHAACAGKVRGIERYHRDTQRWADVAYNAIVCPHGFVFEGRGLHTKSAANGNSHANATWYAVCYLGGEGDGFTEAGQAGMVAAVQWLRAAGNAGPRVNGHRDHKATACPGGAIYAWLQSADFTYRPTHRADPDYLELDDMNKDDLRELIRDELQHHTRYGLDEAKIEDPTGQAAPWSLGRLLWSLRRKLQTISAKLSAVEAQLAELSTEKEK